jgi:hypothetical protein
MGIVERFLINQGEESTEIQNEQSNCGKLWNILHGCFKV